MNPFTQFGKLPAAERLVRLSQSPNYRNGQFHNLTHTPSLTEGSSYYGVMRENFFGVKSRMKPIGPIPTQKTDLLQLSRQDDILVWFGHSSYFMQIDGRRILVDPVLSGTASPVPATMRAFPGSDVYTVGDIPDIDYLFISHDH